MKSISEKFQKHHIACLALVILFAVIRLIYLFSLRDGHHVDETWSYGYANSYYKPHIYSTSNYGSVERECWDNVGKWIKGDVLKDYITVSDGEQFAFDSVLYNKYEDLSPALYELVLHFVSSFFPGKFSWDYAFAISLAFFIPALILIYMIAQEFTGNWICSLACVIYYVFSGTGTANFLYLRVYHMFTFFTLAMFYLIQRIVKHKDRTVLSFILLAITTVLGALTHYYFLVIAFLITLFSVLYLLFKKQFVRFMQLGGVMLLSVVAFFFIYPPSINKLLPFASGEAVVDKTNSVTGYYSYPYSWDLSVANKHFFYGTIGWFIDFNFPSFLMFLGILSFVSAMAGLLVFLFRNEVWMKKACHDIAAYFAKFFRFCFAFVSHLDSTLLVVLLSSAIYIFIIPVSAELYEMGYTERYFFPVMSLFIVGYISLCSMIIKFIFESINKKAVRNIGLALLSMILAVLCLRSNTLTRTFMFDFSNEHLLKEELSGRDCYVYVNALRDLIWLCPLLEDSDDVYIDFSALHDEADIKLPELNPDCCVLILPSGFMTEEQKADYLNNSTFNVSVYGKPGLFMTLEDYIDLIEEQSGNKYVFIDDGLTFIGEMKLYYPEK